MMDDNFYMRAALELALYAAKEGEVPVGCVISDSEGKIIGCGRNRREGLGLSTAHAEIEAINEACRRLGGWRLDGCSLYVTLEPCPMCAGAILNSRIKRLCYGAREPNSGSCGSVVNIFMEAYGFSPEIYGGIMEAECAGIMRDFFNSIR